MQGTKLLSNSRQALWRISAHALQALKVSRAYNAYQEAQPIQKTTRLYEMAPGALSGRNLLINL